VGSPVEAEDERLDGAELPLAAGHEGSGALASRGAGRCSRGGRLRTAARAARLPTAYAVPPTIAAFNSGLRCRIVALPEESALSIGPRRPEIVVPLG
jgi:hypothetical protein